VSGAGDSGGLSGGKWVGWPGQIRSPKPETRKKAEIRELIAELTTKNAKSAKRSKTACFYAFFAFFAVAQEFCNWLPSIALSHGLLLAVSSDFGLREPIAESGAKERKGHKVNGIGPFLCVLCDLLWLRRTSAIASRISGFFRPSVFGFRISGLRPEIRAALVRCGQLDNGLQFRARAKTHGCLQFLHYRFAAAHVVEAGRIGLAVRDELNG